MVILPLLQSLGNQGGELKSMTENDPILALALIAGAMVGAVQTVAGNPSAALTGRLAGEFLGAAAIYMVVFWVALQVIYRSSRAGAPEQKR